MEVEVEQKGVIRCEQDCLQAGMLILVLLIATAYRFYRMDGSSLWGEELANATMILNRGWLDMVSSMVYSSIETPGYASVLYVFSRLFGYSEFALRLPSALAGIGCVYVIYLLGKRVHSSYAGLLAAASVACSYQLVDCSREAHVSSLLIFFMLINFYYFLKIVFYENNNEALTALRIDKKNKIGSFSLVWQAPAAPATFVLFWLTGAVILYLQYMAVFIILSEVFLVFILCSWRGSGERFGIYVCAMFIPVLILFSPWLPAMCVHIGKIVQNFDIDYKGVSNANFIINLLFSRIPQFRILFIFLTVLAVLLGFYALVKRRFSHASATYQDVTLLFFIFFVILLFFLRYFFPAKEMLGYYLVLHPWVMLIISIFLCDVIKNMPFQRARNLIMISIIALFLLVNLGFNQSARLFGDKQTPDVGVAVKIISQDKDFMADAERPVFMSLASMGYYLQLYGVQSDPYKFVVNASGNDIAKIENFSTKERSFYYIDIIDSPEYKASSPILDALLQKYQMVCRSESPWFRLIKFSVDKQSIAAVVDDCNSKIVSTHGSSVAERKRSL